MLQNIVESLAEDVNPNLRVAGIFMTRNSNRNIHLSVEVCVKETFPDFFSGIQRFVSVSLLLKLLLPTKQSLI